MKCAHPESQRDSIHQPRVVPQSGKLPWVLRPKQIQPQRSCITVSQNRRNPFRVENDCDACSQGSRVAPTLGWMTLPRWGKPIPAVPIEQQKPVERLVERILSAKQRDAWADVSTLERELDQLVYALYGLTPEEIKLVEGAAKK